MTPHKIRPARPDDHPAIEALQRRASLAGPEHREQLLAHPDALGLDPGEIAAGRVLVATAESGLTGYANWIAGAGPYEAELDGLFVDPARWRDGIGRALVEAIAAVVRSDHRRQLRVIAGPAAVGFYLRCGFAIVGQATTRFGPAQQMARAL